MVLAHTITPNGFCKSNQNVVIRSQTPKSFAYNARDSRNLRHIHSRISVVCSLNPTNTKHHPFDKIVLFGFVYGHLDKQSRPSPEKHKSTIYIVLVWAGGEWVVWEGGSNVAHKSSTNRIHSNIVLEVEVTYIVFAWESLFV